MSPPRRLPVREEHVEVAPPAPRWPIYAGAAVVGLVLVAGAGLLMLDPGQKPGSQPAPPGDVTSEQVGALKEALVSNQVELARVDFENKDYKGAASRAERALALDPTSTEARQVLELAQRTSAELDTVALEARRAFDAGDTDRATKALSRVLALDPRHPVAGELSAALNVHFRKLAEDARRMTDDSRRSAEAFKADPAYAQAERMARDGSALLQKDEFAVATQKFLEARDGYDRAKRNSEAAARVAAAEAAARAAAAARPVTLPPTLIARNVPPPVVIQPPVNAPIVTLPAPTLPTAAPVAGPTQEPAIRKLIGDYGRAIESKDIALFKSVKPNLTPDEEKRLQESFKGIKSQQVGITIDNVQVDGAQATVKVSRQDTINGKPVNKVQQVFRLTQSGNGWTIQAIGVQ